MNLPDRVAFTIPGTEIEIYWYAICITAGILLAVVIASILTKKAKLPTDTAIDLCLCAVPLGLICARLYYVAFNWEYFDSFKAIIDTRNGGLAIPGGILGGILGVFIYSRIKKKSFFSYADMIVPGLALAQAIGRWGNFFNQEAYGLAVTNPKYLFFPFSVKIENCKSICDVTIQHGHLATFFYESMFCLLLFAILLFAFRRVKHKGDLFLIYSGLYCAERAFIESLRMDALMLGKIRITQLLCIVVVAFVIIFTVVRLIREKKNPQLTPQTAVYSKEALTLTSSEVSSANSTESVDNVTDADSTDGAINATDTENTDDAGNIADVDNADNTDAADNL